MQILPTLSPFGRDELKAPRLNSFGFNGVNMAQRDSCAALGVRTTTFETQGKNRLTEDRWQSVTSRAHRGHG